jgi:hypothetical protein
VGDHLGRRTHSEAAVRARRRVARARITMAPVAVARRSRRRRLYPHRHGGQPDGDRPLGRSWGDRVEVLAPADLRAELRKRRCRSQAYSSPPRSRREGASAVPPRQNQRRTPPLKLRCSRLARS